MPENQTRAGGQTERTNRIVGTVVAGVLLAGGGFLAWQNADAIKGVKLPDRNKMWADTWKKQLSKPRDLPEFKPAVDWSDPKFDPKNLGVTNQNLSIDLSSYQTGSGATSRNNRQR